MAVGRFARTMIAAILVPQREQSFWYAGLHGGRLLLLLRGRRKAWSRRRGVDQKPDGSRLSCKEQLVHVFADPFRKPEGQEGR